MRLAVASLVLLGAAMLGGVAGTAYGQRRHVHEEISGRARWEHRSSRDDKYGATRRYDARQQQGNVTSQHAEPDPRLEGHMSPEDRRLLRQHIEDAVKELYNH